MHIKKITIQGFKTYKTTTVIDRFSPGHNVVVGRNGSGKSNFFAAIRFVLSDAYTHMSREERQGLLHEGSSTIMSAFVEITFDNTDRRFPVARDEVVIRRTIGLKKDDYSLDARAASRADVMNLLESAGFSRSNPYYIVPQGRITALTNSKNAERLALLKEVSGANVFEVRLRESRAEMHATTKRRAKIDEMLLFIEERLLDLAVEKDELRAYQTLERAKKVHEYALLDGEHADVAARIDALELSHDEQLQSSARDLDELEKREAAVAALEAQLAALALQRAVLALEAEQAAADLDLMLAASAQRRVAEAERLDRAAQDEHDARQAEQAARQLDEAIAAAETARDAQRPARDGLAHAERRAAARLALLQGRQRALCAKQSRSANFATRAARDEWLTHHIAALADKRAVRLQHIQSVTAQRDAALERLASLAAEAAVLEETLHGGGGREERRALAALLAAAKAAYTALVDERKTLWRREARLKAQSDALAGDAAKAQRAVALAMGAPAAGITAVRQIAARLGLEGAVFGPLGELIEVHEKYKTAAEVVAGGALCHVVVDTDATARVLMEELARERGGRVTFMPLNRLAEVLVLVPADAVALIRKIACAPAVARAVEHVFGRAVVCASLERGAEVAQGQQLSAVTLDGDRVDGRGIVSGGFRERRLRLDALRAQAQRRGELKAARAELTELAAAVGVADAEITAASSAVSAAEAAVAAAEAVRAPAEERWRAVRHQRAELSEEVAAHETRLALLEATRVALAEQITAHEAERALEFETALSAGEVAQLAQLRGEIADAERRLDAAAAALATAEAAVVRLESELEDNLRPRREQAALVMSRAAAAAALLSDAALLSAAASPEEHAALASAAEAAEAALATCIQETAAHTAALARANKQQEATLAKLEKFQHAAERTLTSQALLTARRDELQKKIRELGVVPEEAFLVTATPATLLLELTQINADIARYAHVNKKALEQHATFTAQRDALVARCAELERAKSAIEDLMAVLAARKGEAISRTFAQVAESFAQVFVKLVPAGAGRLVMLAGEAGGEEWGGVAILVSFNSKSDEQQRIEQLSGGQKSLCAIALILAIQRCDPAPFYLFDEIDANLDAQYRGAVAAVVHELSAGAQFICTTFRPEMIQVADTFYGVMFNNKVSTVSEIQREEAMSFVEGQVAR